MTPSQDIILLMAGLYLIECLVFTYRDAVVFSAMWLWSARPKWAGDVPGTYSHGVFLAWPLPPMGAFFIGQFDPISISPEGVSRVPACRLGENKTQLDYDGADSLTFDEIKSVDVDEKKLLINGSQFVRLVTERKATQYAKFLNTLLLLTREKREKKIVAELARTTDAVSADRRVRRLKKESTTLRIACSTLVVYLFGVCPPVLWFLGIDKTWLMLLGPLLVLWGGSAAIFALTHRRIFRGKVKKRWQTILPPFVSPFSAARSIVTLTKEYLSLYHPLVIAGVVCPEKVYADFAGDVLRDLHYPIINDGDATDEAPEHWMREKMKAVAHQLIRDKGIDPEPLLGMPEREGDSIISYCPRCGLQSMAVDQECPHCSGVTLKSFEAENTEVISC